jgi:hypothetical protein
MTVFELLKQGCEIKFPSGYILKGDPDSGYIETNIELCGEVHTDGLRSLDKEGTRLALNDAKWYEKQNST